MKFLDVTSGNRKLHFDDHAFRFYFESPTETMCRFSAQHERSANINNRCEQKRLDSIYKRYKGMQEIFESKLGSEMDHLRASLKEMVAHRKALNIVANSSKETDGNLGKYGPNATKEDLHPLIEDEKLKLTSTYLRRQKTDSLLRMRRPMVAVDRRLDTNSLMRQWTKYRPSYRETADEEPKKVQQKSCPNAKLKLPAIKVSMNMEFVVHRPSRGQSLDGSKSSDRPVFITQQFKSLTH